MAINKLIIACFIVVITFTTVTAQTTADTSKKMAVNISESIQLHTNNSVFVCGETLFYQFYTLNSSTNKLSDLSKLGYFEIIDKNLSKITHQKLFLSNGTANGDFFISPNLKTGAYKIVAYTNWSLQNNQEVYTKDIFIINPFENQIDKKNTIQQTDTTVESSNLQSQANSRNSTGILTTDKKNYTFREKINFYPVSAEKELKGQFSVSVRKKDKLDYTFELQNKNSNENHVSNTSNTIPEFRGEIIHGTVTNRKNSSDINNIIVALSIPGSNFFLRTTNTNERGEFYLIIDKIYNEKDAFIQVIGENRKDFEIQLNKKSSVDYSNNDFRNFVNFPLNSNWTSEIENRSIANQIENNYYEKKKDTVNNISKTPPFYYPLHKTYILDDYKRFPTIQETITEIVPELSYYSKKNEYFITIKDYDVNSGSLGNAMVLVDGQLIQNINKFFTSDAYNIQRIEVVNKSYIYGPTIYSGIVNFISKNGIYPLNEYEDGIKKIKIDNPHRTDKYYSPDYSKENNKRIPDYRYQLVWIPNLKNLADLNNLNIYTSDIDGTYEVEIIGFSEKGEHIASKTIFQVN